MHTIVVRVYLLLVSVCNKRRLNNHIGNGDAKAFQRYTVCRMFYKYPTVRVCEVKSLLTGYTSGVYFMVKHII